MNDGKFKEYSQLDMPVMDAEILKFWEENGIFQKSIDQRDPNDPYVFYEGPPSANGKPGIHHVMARTVKDLFCRFHTMKGKRVERKGGWDTHGLPIELSVEKELGITKEDIGKKISVDDYNKKCRETVMRYKDLWDDLTRKMGYWVDLDNPYITFENNYIESVWHLLKKLYDNGFLYKGYSIQPYSPAAGTGLSTHELNQPGCYREVSDVSAVAQFELKKDEKSAFLYEKAGDAPVYFLAWTTTPWTLPSNTALAAGPKLTYLMVRTFNRYTHKPINVILAKELLSAWFKPEQLEMALEDYQAGDKIIPAEVVLETDGKSLELISYHQLLPYAQPESGDAFKVLLGDFVTTEDGTGIVHIAPSFGADDRQVAAKYGFGHLTLVDKQGKFDQRMGEFAGRYVKNYKDDPDYKDVNVDIVIKLKKENKAFASQKYLHNYPHCWRTDKPILYYPLDSWFVKTTAVREKMVELNKTINWKPAHTGTKRFGNWLENLQDWNLSRSRYWGIPLPIWRTEDGEEELIIGSIEQLKREIQKANQKLGLDQSVPGDLHRPYIDEVTLVSPGGKPMTRESDLIDVWFDSGSMPYAQWHYPFENEDVFEKNFPADFIAEGVDQTRGWFFTLHAIAAMCFDSVAYKNVVSNGLVQDKDGRKMSKRLGNAIEPFETIAKYGADPTRWYMISNSQPWENLKFDLNGLEEVKRKFFGTLFNTYSFFALYANVDKYDGKNESVPNEVRSELDRWVLSMLHSLTIEVEKHYADYEPTLATRKIQQFVSDHLSNWYVRLGRRRFWKGEMSTDKLAAYQTLEECIITVAKLMAPVAPFFAEFLYRNIRSANKSHRHQSIHLCDFPNVKREVINKALERKMDYAQRITSLVFSLRKKEKIRVRQPLNRILLPVIDGNFKQDVEAVSELIKAEVNVKKIEYVTDASGLIKKKAKPNFKTLGRRLGKDMKSANQLISSWKPGQIAELEKTGMVQIELNGNKYDLSREDVLITSEDIPGWQVAQDGEITVALDTTLTENLKKEGLARELVNRIQNLRKDSDFNVTDRISVRIQNNSELATALEEYGTYVKDEVLADRIEFSDQVDGEEQEIAEAGTTRIRVVKLG
ncbi:MAG: isoleucine--tRNA ligase [Saprospirales bacterium]|nr:MAG: isoleucine--tRNA ligase [Saprospirales bacterium]